ncbi:MAG TPA: TauD/TfdA family dioxygenase [Chthoniobacterales bacterium]|jgi:hypothetical protein|nr:TauD/TfdA family dioxygenase [Chthoniobacterales bacterium]
MSTSVIGQSMLVEHAELRHVIQSWEALPLRDQLCWNAEDASDCICDALLPGLAERGAVRLRLLDSPHRFKTKTLEWLLRSISKQIGFLMPQTYKNNLTARIRDEGKDYKAHNTRGHQTNAELAFHSDRCDLNLLLYVRTAIEGGELSVVSYEEAARRLKRRSATVLGRLFEGFPFDLRDERIFPSIAWYWRPILWNSDTGLRGHYIRRFVNDSQRHADCPRLSTEQIEALDEFDGVLNALRAEHAFSAMPGELLVMDNYRVMHARYGYRDSVSKRDGRLAIRTWVAPFNSQALPVFLFPMSGALAPGSFRGGVGRGNRYRQMLGKLSRPD